MNFKPGQNLQCQILRREPGGYAVAVGPSNAPGFLPTEAMLRPGAEITAQYVCMHNNRILVSARLSKLLPEFEPGGNVVAFRRPKKNS